MVSKVVKVQKFKKKPRPVEAIQFTGINGSDIVEFVKSRGGKARNGGQWVRVDLENNGVSTLVRKKDLVVWNIPGLEVLTYEEFRDSHTISKHHVLMVPKSDKLA